MVAEARNTDFFFRVVCAERSKIEEVEKRTRLQNNSIWTYERSLRITASRAHALFTYKGRDWNSKVEKFFKTSRYKSVAMLYGTRTEKKARKCYAATTRSIVKTVAFIINFEQPWLGCSPDGYIVEQDKLIEIKCPYNGKKMTLADVAHCQVFG